MKKIGLFLSTLSFMSLHGDAGVISWLADECKQRTEVANLGKEFGRGDYTKCLVFAHTIQAAMNDLKGNHLKPDESYIIRWADEYVKNMQAMDGEKLAPCISLIPFHQSSDDVITKADAFTQAHRITHSRVKQDISLSWYAQFCRWLCEKRTIEYLP